LANKASPANATAARLPTASHVSDQDVWSAALTPVAECFDLCPGHSDGDVIALEILQHPAEVLSEHRVRSCPAKVTFAAEHPAHADGDVVVEEEPHGAAPRSGGRRVPPGSLDIR